MPTTSSTPTDKQKVADDLAERLREAILTGDYEPGTKLPPERELARTYGVNRASLREALKKLEHLGLVRIRQGDGTRVTNFMETAGLELVTHLLPLVSQFPDMLGDVLEFREHFGRLVARLACERRTDDDLARLEATALPPTANGGAELTPLDRFAADFQFYVALTRAVHNRVLTLLINTVRDVASAQAEMFSALIPAADEVARHHAAIVAAVRDRDAAAAEAEASRYLKSASQRIIG